VGKGSAPSAPDPYQSAAAQYQYGTQAAAYNAALSRVNQNSPTGSTTYQVTGTDPATGAPIYSQNTTLSPVQQQIFQGQQQQQLGQQGLASQALGGARQAIAQNPLPTLGQNQQFGQQARDAAYGYATSTLDPYWNEQQRSLDSSLRNSGATPGTPAYDNAMNQFHNQRNAAYSQAENQAFGQGLNAQGQQIQQIAQLQDIPLQQYQSLIGGQQVAGQGAGGGGSSVPQVSGVNAPDFMQALQNQYQGQLAGYNANVATGNSELGAATTLLAAFLL